MTTLALICDGDIVGETLGYTVQRPPPHGGTHRGNTAYVLYGKRGAAYRLIRHLNDPEVMYVVNSVGNICALKGNYKFTDVPARQTGTTVLLRVK